MWRVTANGPTKREKVRRLVPFILQEGHEESTKLRHFLLHSKTIHVIILVLLLTDGLICLTSGVLDAQLQHDKAKDCEDYVNKCVAVHHRRLIDWSALSESGWFSSPWFSDSEVVDSPWLDAESEEVETWAADDEFDHEFEENFAPRLLTSHSSSSSSSSSNSSSSSSTHGSSSASHASCAGAIPDFVNHTIHDTETVLKWVSVGILCVFLVEQFLLIWELKSEYLKPMLLLDFFVIVSSIVIEVQVSPSGGILVLVRLWRFARVGHGVFQSKEMVQEIIGEEDETVETMMHAWEKLTPERWEEILTSGSAEALRGSVTEEEKQIAAALGNSPAVAMRSLAFARGWKQKLDKKRAKQQARMGATKTGQSVGKPSS